MVSVIIPVYCASEEHEKFLSEALSSVTVQTFRDFEVIIVDDVSPRDISPIISSIKGLPELRVIRNEKNLRHAKCRNLGIEEARGELIAFLDHDDLWDPEKLEKQVAALKADDNAAMVFCGVRKIGPAAHLLKIDQTLLPKHPDFEWFMRHGNYVITATSVMVRRSALSDIGLFDPRYTTSDDLDAWLKIVLRWPIAYMKQDLASYRLHSANVNYGVDRLNDTRLLFSHYLAYFRKAPLTRKLRLLKPMARKIAGQIYFRLRALI